jgi:hypothetical protein
MAAETRRLSHRFHLVCGEKSVKLQAQGTKSGHLDKKVYQFPEIG